MDEKNELSDIMLDKRGSTPAKKRKILLFVVLLIVLFLIALVGMKLFNKPEVKKNNFNIVLPPEPSAKTSSTKEDLFKQVPIIEENATDKKNSFNAMVEKLKNREKQKEVNSTKVVNKVKTEIQSQIKSKPKIDKKIIKTNVTGANKGVYVQVGVTFRTKPDKKYLKKITAAGYHYRLYKLKISGKNATKILIGPYKSKKSARASLAKIKKSINKAAFIYVIK